MATSKRYFVDNLRVADVGLSGKLLRVHDFSFSFDDDVVCGIRC